MKGKRTDLSDSRCGIARSLQIVGDWWTLLIVRDAFNGARRFGEFQKSLGLAKNILSSRLKKLVDEGVFCVEPDPSSSLSHLYVLTPKGRGLGVIIVALWQWGEANCFASGEVQYHLVDEASGKPLDQLRLTAGNGTIVDAGNFRLARINSDQK